MGYRDDFYIEDNIIGYTGDIRSNPTVYFADAGGASPRLQKVGDRMQVLVQFGHITQAHGIPTNVGREIVREAYSYSISNVMVEGVEKSQECIYGLQEAAKAHVRGTPTERGKSPDEQHLSFHTSRNRFESVTSGNRALLALAIRNYPNLKAMYTRRT